jgi:hypothetical protein
MESGLPRSVAKTNHHRIIPDTIRKASACRPKYYPSHISIALKIQHEMLLLNDLRRQERIAKNHWCPEGVHSQKQHGQTRGTCATLAACWRHPEILLMCWYYQAKRWHHGYTGELPSRYLSAPQCCKCFLAESYINNQ